MGCCSSTEAPSSEPADRPAPPPQDAEFTAADFRCPITESTPREPMLLLDSTGSMNAPTSASDSTPRLETIKEAISIIVEKLGAEDAQASKEQGEDEEGGGLRTVTFSAGTAVDIGDLNPDNLREKWKGIEFDGSTYVMPGWKKILQVYREEFGKEPIEERPVLMLLIITDGEAFDYDEFSATLNGFAGGKLFVTMAVIGFGNDHDIALASYRRVEAQNSHVKVISLDSETDPNKIANILLKSVESKQ